MDEWRRLLYPLGFIASLFFGSRFIVQWVASERRGYSFVPKSFWIFSLCGNLLLGLHSIIQIQFHVCLAQVSNGVIGWRNLNLMKPREERASFITTVLLMSAGLVGTILLFILQDWMIGREGHWFRVPQAPWKENTADISFSWHLMGFFAYLLFCSRFWVQWWYAEREQKSELPPLFWWLSLVGTAFTLLYFWKIGDLVNIIGSATGLVPYVRNLMLLYKPKQPIAEHE